LSVIILLIILVIAECLAH